MERSSGFLAEKARGTKGPPEDSTPFVCLTLNLSSLVRNVPLSLLFSLFPLPSLNREPYSNTFSLLSFDDDDDNINRILIIFLNERFLN